jgi:hypothetical protein
MKLSRHQLFDCPVRISNSRFFGLFVIRPKIIAVFVPAPFVYLQPGCKAIFMLRETYREHVAKVFICKRVE